MKTTINIISFLGVCAFMVGFFLLMFVEIEISENVKTVLLFIAGGLAIWNVTIEIKDSEK